MEAEPKPSEQDESRSSELSSVDLSDIESDSEAPVKVEWLATGRQRRATAGNRMKTMLANEEPDSDLELLFAEDDDDQGFSDDAENASDVQMDSSSDDEDETNANDELEGEHELEKQDKARRAAQRKRKAQAAIPAKFRKKVRIDTTATTPSSTAATTPAPRLDNNTNKKNKKKKSERTSWLPSAADLPTRASSRQTTRLSKEQLHAQMEERERKRLKQLAQMEKKAARLEALKKPPMTQEDRLREAAEVEERNSKSLNRWEEAEKLREEERRAKLAALHERTLRGPVITFWSGKGHFGDGFVKTEGINVVVEEKPKRQKKEKASKEPKGKDKKKVQGEGEAGKTDVNGPAPETVAKTESQADAAKSGDASATTQAPATNGDAKVDENKDGNKKTDGESEVADVTMMDAPAVKETDAKESDAKAQDNSQKADAPQNVIAETADAPRPDEKAAETTEPTTEAPTEAPSEETSKKSEAEKQEEAPPAAKEAEQIKTEDAEPASTTPAEKPAEQPTEQQNEPKTDDGAQNRDKTQMPVQAQGAAPKGTLTAPTTDGIDTTQANDTAPQPTATITTDTTNTAPQNPLNLTENNSQTQPETSTPQPTEPKNEKDGKPTTRNAITYQNFNENAIRDKPIQTQILFGRKMNRLPKPAPQPICPITGSFARYRDPVTNMTFYSAAACKELRRVASGEYRWSKLLGAWAGSGTYAARGVPERFLNPHRCATLEEVQRIEQKKVARIEAEKQKKKEEEEKEAEDAKKKKEKKEEGDENINKKETDTDADAEKGGVAETSATGDVKMEEGASSVDAEIAAA